MAAQSSEEHAFRELQSEQSELLDVIDQLRTQGIGRLVELPQLIVCGDQSSGKSSVLEAISRVRFPAKDGLCTRFATELILRRNPLESVKVTIEPGQSRANVEEIKRLRDFSAPFSTTADLPELINAATQWMGISPTGGSNAGFSDDVLKVEISGPDKPELTLVDLPGLYHATREGQGAEGILVVRSLIEAYMKNTKSIILAVISARSNYVLQPILNLAREHDSRYERTLGIITKPDSLSPNSSEEDFYIKLANNEEIKLELGWHILRNRGSENKDSSNDARDDMEREFFSRGRWATVPREFVGVETLRPRLSSVLLSHIRGSLPKLIEEIDKKIKDYEQRLKKLGTERSNPQQQRGYLLNISTGFERITGDAINGMYSGSFFGGFYSTLPSPGNRRLRAVVRGLNEEFVVNMSLHGRRRLIINDSSKEQTTTERPTNSTGIAMQRQPSLEQECITRSELEKEITKLAPDFRGIELPGSSNPFLVGQLFRDQSKPWEKLAQDHLMTVWNAVKNFVKSLLQHLTNEHTSQLLLRNILDPALEDMKQSLLKKLEELVSYNKKRHPLPLDESFLTSIQKVQEESQMALLEKTLLEKHPDAFESNSKKRLTIEELRAAFSAARPGSDRFAAADIIYLMEVYYNIASTTFIDNVVILAIENCLIQPLESIFTNQTVNNLHWREASQLAAEPAYVQLNRTQYQSDLEGLEEGLRICKSFDTAGSQPHNFHLPLELSAEAGALKRDLDQPPSTRRIAPQNEPEGVDPTNFDSDSEKSEHRRVRAYADSQVTISSSSSLKSDEFPQTPLASSINELASENPFPLRHGTLDGSSKISGT